MLSETSWVPMSLVREMTLLFGKGTMKSSVIWSFSFSSIARRIRTAFFGDAFVLVILHFNDDGNEQMSQRKRKITKNASGHPMGTVRNLQGTISGRYGRKFPAIN